MLANELSTQRRTRSSNGRTVGDAMRRFADRSTWKNCAAGLVPSRNRTLRGRARVWQSFSVYLVNLRNAAHSTPRTAPDSHGESYFIHNCSSFFPPSKLRVLPAAPRDSDLSHTGSTYWQVRRFGCRPGACWRGVVHHVSFLTGFPDAKKNRAAARARASLRRRGYHRIRYRLPVFPVYPRVGCVDFGRAVSPIPNPMSRRARVGAESPVCISLHEQTP